MKKLLDVTTKGWSKNDLQKLKGGVDAKNYRWEAHIITKEGKKKFCYFYTKMDLELAASQLKFKILKVKKI